MEVNITGTDSIFILNTKGANLQIQNSTFNQISCTEIGGIIYSVITKTLLLHIYDSSFVLTILQLQELYF